MPDQTCSILDLSARNPADRFDRVGRIAPAEPGVELEDRMTDYFSLRRHNPVFALERKTGAVAA